MFFFTCYRNFVKNGPNWFSGGVCSFSSTKCETKYDDVCRLKDNRSTNDIAWCVKSSTFNHEGLDQWWTAVSSHPTLCIPLKSTEHWHNLHLIQVECYESMFQTTQPSHPIPCVVKVKKNLIVIMIVQLPVFCCFRHFTASELHIRKRCLSMLVNIKVSLSVSICWPGNTNYIPGQKNLCART